MASDKRQCLVTFLCGWPKPQLKKKIALPLWGVPLVIWYRPRRLTLTAWGGWCYVIWRVAFVVRSSPRGNLRSSNVVSDRFSLKCGTNAIAVGQPRRFN